MGTLRMPRYKPAAAGSLNSIQEQIESPTGNQEEGETFGDPEQTGNAIGDEQEHVSESEQTEKVAVETEQDASRGQNEHVSNSDSDHDTDSENALADFETEIRKDEPYYTYY